MEEQNLNYTLIRNECVIRVRIVPPAEQSAIEEQLATNCVGGVFIETVKPYNVGACVEFDFSVPGKSTLYTGRGKVDWVNPQLQRGRPPGMGIKLVEVSSAITRSAQSTSAAAAATSSPLPANVSTSAAAATPAAPPPPLRVQLPGVGTVTEYLSSLLGTNAVAKTLEDENATLTGAAVTAVYGFDDGSIAGLAVWQLGLAINAGAALSLISPQVAAEAAANGEITDNILENFREILNVGTSLFTGSERHIALRTVCLPKDPLPDDAQVLQQNESRRKYLEITIPDYGSGRIALIVK